MADYYTQFSQTLDVPDQWTAGLLPRKGLLEAWTSWWNELIYEGEDEDLFGECSIELSHGTPWLYAEEGGNVETAATVIEEYLRFFGFQKEYGVLLSWANTCSKMRTDGFSGGGMVVTREGVVSTAQSWDAARDASEAGITVHE